MAFRQDSNEVTQCLSHIKQLSIGTLMYVQDYDERYPPMKEAAYVKPRVMPYIKNESIFSCPTSHEAFVPNPALNYVSIAEVQSPATMMVWRDAKPHDLGEGKLAWNVGYVDGHAKPSPTEIPLGKLAPAPKPIPRKRQLEMELSGLKRSLKYTQSRIRMIEAQLKRSNKGH
jgi:hypothetical protein